MSVFQDFLANGRQPTHVLMDGGILHVTQDRLNEFYSRYVQSIFSEKKIFVVEQKTENYKLFVDVDYVDDEALTVENVKSISQIICDKVRSLCEDQANCMCIISVAKPKPKNGMIKTGVHYNWPHVVVNQKIALAIRDHLTFHLSKIYSAKTWTNILDSSVYGNPKTGSQGSGFRMPWSYKKIKDSIEGSYLPVFSYTYEKIIDISRTVPDVEMLRAVAIRTLEPTNVNVTEPEIFSLQQKPGHNRKLTGKEVVDTEISVVLEEFIRKFLKGQERSYVQKVLKDRKRYVVQTNSRYCENIGRNHSSNHVWFLIKDDGSICQKCFCTCETYSGRKKGMCKNFSGQRHQLSPKITNLLYPDKSKKTWLNS